MKKGGSGPGICLSPRCRKPASDSPDPPPPCHRRSQTPDGTPPGGWRDQNDRPRRAPPTMTASVTPIDTAAVADGELPVATRHRCRSVREEGKASNAKRQSTDHAVGGDRGLIVLA